MSHQRLKERIDRASERVLPRHCGLCGVSTPANTLCGGCRRELPWIAHSCVRCGTPLATSPPNGIACGPCQKRPPPFADAFAPVHYAFPVDRLIKAFKFGRRLDLGPLLATLMCPWVNEHRHRFDALLPVPLNRWRNAVRGFNQAHELAARLRTATGLPVCRRVVRQRRTQRQSGLDTTARRNNVRGAFRVTGTLPYRRILLVDDVMTTGETCRELASVLLGAGVDSVSVVTVARASAVP